MYDVLTTRYTFSCPTRGETSVRLSAFRVLERLPGAAHPAVYRISFDCPCGEQHPGLVTHGELDWAPLGVDANKVTFVNLMTAKLEAVAGELGQVSAQLIQAGRWPWSFFCYPEELPRPVFPSFFALIAPGAGGDRVGVAVRCPACARTSINLVSPSHIDLPFHDDPEIGVVEHVFAADAETTLEEFKTELYSASFDARRLHLH
jgi:hypothetical protein